ncbi:MAG: 2-oxoacid:acceptor oxidoreductase subunit alpha [Candidatus Kerfeldbacteria bacterium]|nr:2-oxoacid:acceptor oxidoreductase subunit alpha [Candidatus Kerfeldbacteria bacterium]
MPTEVFNWKICGVGGYGLQVASSMLGKTFLRGGLNVQTYDEFPSVIKGGPATSQVAASVAPIRSPRQAVQLLVCLNEQSIRDHVRELVPGGWLLYDPDAVPKPSVKRTDLTLFPAPLTRITQEVKAEKIMRNVVSIGATLGLLGFSTDLVNQQLRQQYGQKGEEVVQENLKAVEAGATYATEHAPAKFPFRLKVGRRRQRRMLISGNDALGLGALAAGVRFYAGYPMTPSTSLLFFMVKHGPDFGVVVRQLPDEIAVINAAIGASFAGVRSMVATSGGGFSLMVESLGLAAMTETPLVVVNAQRPGPATGLPTWTEQGDLRFVMHAAPGDFPRVVVAPGDVTECFQAMSLAFNIADRYQTPVVVLTDKFLGESSFTTDAMRTTDWRVDRGPVVTRGVISGEHGMFPRYADTPSGVSPRPFPGTPGLPYMANSDEHDEFGLSTEEASVRLVQHAKRMRKLTDLAWDLPEPERYGPTKADLTLLSWGSTKGPALDALELLAAEGIRINLIHFFVLHPFPAATTIKRLAGVKRLVTVEGNASGQLAGLIRQHTGLAIEDQILRYDGRPFEAVELAAAVRERLGIKRRAHA